MPAMTVDLAEECIRRVKAKAVEMGISLCIAVVDDGGTLITYVRMGDKRGGFGEKLAMAKARTAVGFKRTTQESLERYANLPANYYIISTSALYPDEFCVVPGGAPVINNGELLGGVGVSGSTSENDHKCVTEALQGIRF
jgi:uncharacterized protein GlcG (DUF336 family)